MKGYELTDTITVYYTNGADYWNSFDFNFVGMQEAKPDLVRVKEVNYGNELSGIDIATYTGSLTLCRSNMISANRPLCSVPSPPLYYDATATEWIGNGSVCITPDIIHKISSSIGGSQVRFDFFRLDGERAEMLGEFSITLEFYRKLNQMIPPVTKTSPPRF